MKTLISPCIQHFYLTMKITPPIGGRNFVCLSWRTRDERKKVLSNFTRYRLHDRSVSKVELTVPPSHIF